jgi:hypothetical protein
MLSKLIPERNLSADRGQTSPAADNLPRPLPRSGRDMHGSCIHVDSGLLKSTRHDAPGAPTRKLRASDANRHPAVSGPARLPVSDTADPTAPWKSAIRLPHMHVERLRPGAVAPESTVAILGIVQDECTPKAWVLGLPAGPPLKDSPERLIAAAGSSDAASNPYYQLEVDRAMDPTYLRQETARRQFRGQYLRRLRRLRQREKHDRA